LADNLKHKLELEALTYLDQHTVITVATYGPQGIWAAALFYANDLFDIFFLSAAHTRHTLNMAAQKRVSGTIQENYRDWESIKGIQLEGVVEKLSDDGATRAMKIYAKKFPLIANNKGSVKTALAGIDWYRLIPERLYLIDNSKSFGHRDEIDLSGP
jgi:uncharacterized protein YhbP (UPF0306 family)